MLDLPAYLRSRLEYAIASTLTRNEPMSDALYRYTKRYLRGGPDGLEESDDQIKWTPVSRVSAHGPLCACDKCRGFYTVSELLAARRDPGLKIEPVPVRDVHLDEAQLRREYIADNARAPTATEAADAYYSAKKRGDEATTSPLTIDFRLTLRNWPIIDQRPCNIEQMKLGRYNVVVPVPDGYEARVSYNEGGAEVEYREKW